jgi:hypothetical protein
MLTIGASQRIALETGVTVVVPDPVVSSLNNLISCFEDDESLVKTET